MNKRIVIIAAGGTGSRINADLPKQYMLLNDKPVLMHTIAAFVECCDLIVVALHSDMVQYWTELCLKYDFAVPHEMVIGGKTRFQSIRNAINFIEQRFPEVFYEEGNSIAVHDAARPLVDKELIEKSFELAEKGQCNVLATRSTNSIRLGGVADNKAVDRDTVWQIQTPQTFPAHLLLQAYRQPEEPLFTDDASVIEKIGYPIHLLESSPKNIKITYAEDFEIAKIYMK